MGRIEHSRGSERTRIVYAVTSPMSAGTLLKGQLQYLADRGYEVHLVTGSDGHEHRFPVRDRGVSVHRIPLEREISFLTDLSALIAAVKLMRRLQPSLTNVSTPKASLICGLAALIARVPVRILNVRGLRSESEQGLKRRLLTWSERLSCLIATDLMAISPSLRSRLWERRIVPRNRSAKVIASGSSNGVDLDQFNAQRFDKDETSSFKKSLGLSSGMVIGFLGRLTQDKGIEDLLLCWQESQKEYPGVQLLIVGDIETSGSTPHGRLLMAQEGLVVTGFVADPSPYLALMDVMVFPSRREGFGNAALEAAAMGVPVVAYRVTGITDAVADGESGFLVEPGNQDALLKATSHLLGDRNLRQVLGKRAIKRARRCFSQDVFWAELGAFYSAALRANGDADKRNIEEGNQSPRTTNSP